MEHVSNIVSIIFSWKLEDLASEIQVERIPEIFTEEDQYLDSFKLPLLEDVRAELYSSLDAISEAPYAAVTTIAKLSSGRKATLSWEVNIGKWETCSSDSDDPHLCMPGDIILLSETKIETADDLNRGARAWCFGYVSRIPNFEVIDNELERSSNYIIETSAPICTKRNQLFVCFLINITTKRRIWNSLSSRGTSLMRRQILDDESEIWNLCSECTVESDESSCTSFEGGCLATLNESQREAVLSCLRKVTCDHKPSMELIWGAPGTGKTKTLSALLYILLKMNYRTLICAPSNIAVKELAVRVISLLEDGSFGDVLLVANSERLKLQNSDIEKISLEYRARKLMECFLPETGMFSSLKMMIRLLEDGRSLYSEFCNSKESGENSLSYVEYCRKSLEASSSSVRSCLRLLCMHVSTSFIKSKNVEKFLQLLDSLESFESLVSEGANPAELERISTTEGREEGDRLTLCGAECLLQLHAVLKCLQELKLLHFANEESVIQLCQQNAKLIFSTASSSCNIPAYELANTNILLIDEAAQLKECETLIPLQFPSIKHVILVGDEYQLSTVVHSPASSKALYGRSLFERMKTLGFSRRLLNKQYRMHPAISIFPNLYCYDGQIEDALIVRSEAYTKRFLEGDIFQPYSFINVSYGREELDGNGRSLRNMMEVAIVLQILHRLRKVGSGSLSIGIISPYPAQVREIKRRIGNKYTEGDRFSVCVKSVDGFQGGEKDVIILSTVRSNVNGNIGFLSNTPRANVALTRAKHFLWIIGDEKTLIKSESIWASLVSDAKNRSCFFHADDNKELRKVIIEVKKEYNELDDLLCGNCELFRNSVWKVIFSENFRKSFRRLPSSGSKASVMHFLLKLSSGWRPKRMNSEGVLAKTMKVEGLLMVSSIDINQEAHSYAQVLKIWDLLPSEEVPSLLKRLSAIFDKFSNDYTSRCKEICVESDIEVPKRWPLTFKLACYKNELKKDDDEAGSTSGEPDLSPCYVENSKINDSLLLMKFYALSSGIAKHLLSNRDGVGIELPFEVTIEEQEIIAFPKSTFILGRSGTGKTTIITMKLFRREQLFSFAKEGLMLHDDPERTLRQLFVTVSPKLCLAIKRHITQLKSFASGEVPENTTFDDEDNINESSRFISLKESFRDVPSSNFPLIISFQTFLIMLDRSIGESYFSRFNRDQCSETFVQNFIKTREVTYEKFSVSYWPRFDSNLTKILNPSRVYTEIISHIKGSSMRILDRDRYVKLSEMRSSTLNEPTREIVYLIYMAYEKMKAINEEFDLADFVNDLHDRLETEDYKGLKMDFVYIDEVQDLTTKQIGLFKHVCSNVEEGFVFAGDTAQTIARGIDFRFEDIRSIFYTEFALEKGQISDTFQLTRNYRTHAGVLHLAQSIIDLLYRYFPSGVDILRKETSLIFGEAPVLLESGNDENSILTIFGNSRSCETNFVGFGASQVILVRDEETRSEVREQVGKNALVLTILECKGLEFQDVLLYNFFGSSPMEGKWRVVYSFMKENSIETGENSPCFDFAKHNIMCSELKQLYVAITRTRQRLWISENTEEFAAPMFDYWKKKGLVQKRKLDDSLAHAMQVYSTPEEWKEQGYKLLREGNYEMATLCFERGGYVRGEKLAKASGHKSTADRLRSSDPESAMITYRHAGEIFEEIGVRQQAAECFYELKEYERAGKLYLLCGEKSTEVAGECFLLGGCFEQAAEVYYKGRMFAKCLSSCCKGKLFELGLRYIVQWKKNHDEKELCEAEQKFLESAAEDRHVADDKQGLIRYVKAFDSIDNIRAFLKFHKRYDELLIIEEEDGDYLEQKNLEKCLRSCSRGDLLDLGLRYIEMWRKKSNDEPGELAQEFLESAALSCLSKGDKLGFMKFVRSFKSFDNTRIFFKSLNRLNDLKLLEIERGNFLEAASLAKEVGDVLEEADLLGKANCSKEASLLILKYVLSNSLWWSGKGWPLKNFPARSKAIKKAKDLSMHVSNEFHRIICSDTEILSSEHFSFTSLKHQMKDIKSSNILSQSFLVRRILDIHFGSDSFNSSWIIGDVVSFGTLMHYWKLWQSQIATALRNGDQISEFSCYYFGLRKENDLSFCLINPEATWLKNLGVKSSKGRIASDIKLHEIVNCYWREETLLVGKKVLHKLKLLISPTRFPILCKSRCQAEIFKLAQSLLEEHDDLELHKYMSEAASEFFDCAFPFDWRTALHRDIIRVRKSDVSSELMSHFVSSQSAGENALSFRNKGTIAVTLLGSAMKSDSIVNIPSQPQSVWSTLIQYLAGDAEARGSLDVMIMHAIEQAYFSDWNRDENYISPKCFVYLLERLHVLACYSKKCDFFVSKSSLTEWLIHEGDEFRSPVSHRSCNGIASFIERLVSELLVNDETLRGWMVNTKQMNIYDCTNLTTLRLAMIAYSLFLNFGKCERVLLRTVDLFPNAFYAALSKCFPFRSMNGVISVIAKAFADVRDPLVLVRRNGQRAGLSHPNVVFVGMAADCNPLTLLEILYPGVSDPYSFTSKNESPCSSILQQDDNVSFIIGPDEPEEMKVKSLCVDLTVDAMGDQDQDASLEVQCKESEVFECAVEDDNSAPPNSEDAQQSDEEENTDPPNSEVIVTEDNESEEFQEVENNNGLDEDSSSEEEVHVNNSAKSGGQGRGKKKSKKNHRSNNRKGKRKKNR